MPDRYKVADESKLSEDGSRVIVDIEGVEIAVFRIDGEYHALSNYCIHQGGPLCEGDLSGRNTVDRETWEWRYSHEEKNVLCPWHGWMFDVTTGQSIDTDRYAIPTYDVEIENEEVFVVV